MSLAACLLLYSAAVLLLAPPVLRILTRAGHTPRCGVVAWLVAIGSVMLTWLIASVLVVLDEVAHWSQQHSFVNSCIAMVCQLLAGEPGSSWQLIVQLGAAAIVGAIGVATVRLAWATVRLRAHAHDHADGVRMVGRPTADQMVVVLDSDRPAAYCVAGNPSMIVVTSAAVEALDEGELDAVLAHERAHVRGHHLTLALILRAVALVFPRLALMRDGVAEVTRLLEMCADDAAVRHFGQQSLLNGLLAVAGRVPATALGAADIAVLTRARRLALPAARRQVVRSRAALASTSALLALAPVVTVVLTGFGLLFQCT